MNRRFKIIRADSTTPENAGSVFGIRREFLLRIAECPIWDQLPAACPAMDEAVRGDFSEALALVRAEGYEADEIEDALQWLADTMCEMLVEARRTLGTWPKDIKWLQDELSRDAVELEAASEKVPHSEHAPMSLREYGAARAGYCALVENIHRIEKELESVADDLEILRLAIRLASENAQFFVRELLDLSISKCHGTVKALVNRKDELFEKRTDVGFSAELFIKDSDAIFTKLATQAAELKARQEQPGQARGGLEVRHHAANEYGHQPGYEPYEPPSHWQPSYNPASGLPMINETLDVGGNVFGTNDSW